MAVISLLIITLARRRPDLHTPLLRQHLSLESPAGECETWEPNKCRDFFYGFRPPMSRYCRVHAELTHMRTFVGHSLLYFPSPAVSGVYVQVCCFCCIDDEETSMPHSLTHFFYKLLHTHLSSLLLSYRMSSTQGFRGFRAPYKKAHTQKGRASIFRPVYLRVGLTE